ncbi:MAG: HNH endonuclease [Candidatus Neomarinimicrobiota bacterium]
MNKRKYNFTQEQLSEYFDSNPYTGQVFDNKTDEEVGFLHRNVYQIKLPKELAPCNYDYAISRAYVIWVMEHGSVSKQIRHINRDRKDDRLVNLSISPVGKTENKAVEGVVYQKNIGKWLAYYCLPTQRVCKFFMERADAIECRKEMEAKYDTI